MKKVSNNKIAQHQFNSKTVYNKQHTSSHVTQTSQLLDFSLFFSVSTPFSHEKQKTPQGGRSFLEYSPGGLPKQTNKQTNKQTLRAESKTVLGEDRAPRVEASQGFDSPGFIQPNKQTNKQKIWRIL